MLKKRTIYAKRAKEFKLELENYLGIKGLESLECLIAIR